MSIIYLTVDYKLPEPKVMYLNSLFCPTNKIPNIFNLQLYREKQQILKKADWNQQIFNGKLINKTVPKPFLSPLFR